jgi:small-conductance mechanosensitive channel
MEFILIHAGADRCEGPAPLATVGAHAAARPLLPAGRGAERVALLSVGRGVQGRSRRLLRAGLATALLLALLSARDDLVALVPDRYQAPARIAILVLAALAGAQAVRDAVVVATAAMDPQGAVVWRNLASWTLYALLGLWIASVANLNLSGLLLGGAIVGVVVAAASQASLGNFFAGLLLMLARPYRVGAAVRLRGPSLAGVEYQGTVADVGALYTTLETPAGERLKLPNSAVVSSTLALGEAPVQAEIEVELPLTMSLHQVLQALRAQLSSGRVTITPVRISASGDGSQVCRVQLRSASAVEPAQLADALADAVQEVTAGDRQRRRSA